MGMGWPDGGGRRGGRAGLGCVRAFAVASADDRPRGGAGLSVCLSLCSAAVVRALCPCSDRVPKRPLGGGSSPAEGCMQVRTTTTPTATDMGRGGSVQLKPGMQMGPRAGIGCVSWRAGELVGWHHRRREGMLGCVCVPKGGVCVTEWTTAAPLTSDGDDNNGGLGGGFGAGVADAWFLHGAMRLRRVCDVRRPLEFGGLESLNRAGGGQAGSVVACLTPHTSHLPPHHPSFPPPPPHETCPFPSASAHIHPVALRPPRRRPR